MARLDESMTVGRVIGRVARRHARREALVWHDLRITYDELLRQIDAVARGCLALGLRKGDKVALLLPNRPEYIYCFLGVTRFGGVIVPINPVYRRRELAHILNDAEVAMVIAVPEVRGYRLLDTIDLIRPSLPIVCHYVFVADEAPPWAMRFGELVRPSRAPFEPADPPAPDDLFGLIYTSGTTGLPKGTMHTHGTVLAPILAGEELRRTLFHFSPGFARRLVQMVRLYGWRFLRWGSRQQTFMGPAPLHAMAGYSFMLHALAYGYRFVIVDWFDPQQVLQTIEREHVNVMAGTPTMFQMLLSVRDLERYNLSSLILADLGAAPCPPALARELRRRLGCAVAISFGATETASAATLTDIVDPERLQAETVGRVYPGTEIRVVDEQRREVPRGAVGEVAVRSRGIMKGYYKAPELTAQVLDADGWYYTGDLGTLDEQGYLRIVGRKKDLIIRGGQNIYPTEIEHVLLAHPAVAEAAVVGVPGGAGDESVWAFVRLREGTAATERELLAYLRAEVAPYKVPDVIGFVGEFPHTPTGKIPKYQLVEQVLGEKRNADSMRATLAF